MTLFSGEHFLWYDKWMHRAIQKHIPAITQICSKHCISRLEVFGSAAHAVDFAEKTSDADFLVEFLLGTRPGLDEFFCAKADLEKLLGRNVDLVQTKAIRNPYVLASINQSRELVYAVV
jgi:uncharacterized protein